jgi:uncharacterized protein YlxW (UPF0749 family)
MYTMRKIQITCFLAALFLALALAPQGYAQSSESRPSDACEGATSKVQANPLLDLEVVARAEDRAAALRMQLFNIQTQEFDLQSRIEELDYRLTPESIQRALTVVTSVSPMDERRKALSTRLENEKARVNKQLELLASSRERLEAAISRADAEVERLRQRLSAP